MGWIPCQERLFSGNIPTLGTTSIQVFGGVSEWPMEHAWKACKRDKRFVGSNPTSSVGRQKVRWTFCGGFEVEEAAGSGPGTGAMGGGDEFFI